MPSNIQVGKKKSFPLCEQEAEKTGNYLRLVKALKEAKRFEEAEQWVHKGIKATQKQWPGIASQLRGALLEMTREGRQIGSRSTAFGLKTSSGSPSLQAYEDMKKAAERAKVWPLVREVALRYLETGKLPQTDPSWPLPQIGVAKDTDYRIVRSPP